MAAKLTSELYYLYFCFFFFLVCDFPHFHLAQSFAYFNSRCCGVLDRQSLWRFDVLLSWAAWMMWHVADGTCHLRLQRQSQLFRLNCPQLKLCGGAAEADSVQFAAKKIWPKCVYAQRCEARWQKRYGVRGRER